MSPLLRRVALALTVSFALASTGCEAEAAGCVDGDGDGSSVGSGCATDLAPDCDDRDATSHPGATEVCGDGVDQDCSGSPDDGECIGCVADVGLGGRRSCGVGACAGEQACTADGWGACEPSVTPTGERCGADGTGDGVDDDCDGLVDDGCAAADAG